MRKPAPLLVWIIFCYITFQQSSQSPPVESWAAHAENIMQRTDTLLAKACVTYADMKEEDSYGVIL